MDFIGVALTGVRYEFALPHARIQYCRISYDTIG